MGGFVGAYLGDSSGGGTSPSTPSVVIVSPVSPNPLLQDTPIVFTVTDPNQLRRVFVYIVLAERAPFEVVHDGLRWGGSFTNGVNSRVSITNGYQYTILRDGGWPVTPLLRVLPVNTMGSVPA